MSGIEAITIEFENTNGNGNGKRKGQCGQKWEARMKSVPKTHTHSALSIEQSLSNSSILNKYSPSPSPSPSLSLSFLLLSIPHTWIMLRVVREKKYN